MVVRGGKESEGKDGWREEEGRPRFRRIVVLSPSASASAACHAVNWSSTAVRSWISVVESRLARGQVSEAWWRRGREHVKVMEKN